MRTSFVVHARFSRTETQVKCSKKALVHSEPGPSHSMQSCFSAASDACKCLVQVNNQIVDFFNAYGETDQRIMQTNFIALLGRH